MSDALLKTALWTGRQVIPYLPHLPRPLLTLAPTLALHLASSPRVSLHTFLQDPLSHPLHLPLLFTLASIPVITFLGVLTGNVSWVDRLWPIYPPFCSSMIVLWGCVNSGAGIYGHNLPRLACMMFLQLVWSGRLLSHAIRRGVYSLSSEDYRYTQFRKFVPRWFFQFVHIVIIAVAQPILLFALALPLHAALILPPTELSAGLLPAVSLPYSTFIPFLPSRFHSALPSTPILNVNDLTLTLIGLVLLFIESKADNAMFAFQTSKHASQSTDLVQHPKAQSTNPNLPLPTPYPRSYHPGFMTTGLFKISRHPNFAAEQLFWLVQALFVVGAGESSGVTRYGWVGGGVFGPCFALSVLFCASTFLTEWITQRKYPAYKSYCHLVGQFLPQETVLVRLWSLARGRIGKARAEVYEIPAEQAR